MQAKLQFLLIAICVEQICGTLYTDHETMLRRYLFEQYDTEIIPRVSRSKPLVVNHSMSLIRIDSIENHILSIETWMTMNWVDHRLSWDSSMFAGITELKADSGKVWKPDIYLYNSAGSVDSFKYDDVKVVIKHDGSIYWIPPVRLSVPCNPDNTVFTCTFIFGSWVYSGNEFNLMNTSTFVDMTDYFRDYQIDIVSSSVRRNENFYTCCPEPYIDLTYSLTMKRVNDGIVPEIMPLQLNSTSIANSTTKSDYSSDESSEEKDDD